MNYTRNPFNEIQNTNPDDKNAKYISYLDTAWVKSVRWLSLGHFLSAFRGIAVSLAYWQTNIPS